MANIAPKKGATSRFFAGMGYVVSGLNLGFSRNQLVPWVLLPALLTIVITLGGTGLVWHFLRAFVDRHTGGHGALVSALIFVAVMVLALGFAYVLYVATALLATAPFAGTLSERTEELTRGRAHPPSRLGESVYEAVRGLGHTILSVLCYLALAVPLLVLSFVVPALSPLLWLVGLVQTGLFLAYDGFNEPLHRRKQSFGQKWQFISAHRAEALGFGIAGALAMAVPFLSLLVPPILIIGGTRLYLDLTLDRKALPPA